MAAAGQVWDVFCMRWEDERGNRSPGDDDDDRQQHQRGKEEEEEEGTTEEGDEEPTEG